MKIIKLKDENRDKLLERSRIDAESVTKPVLEIINDGVKMGIGS